MKAIQNFNESSDVMCDSDNQKQTGGRAGDSKDVEILFESDRMDRIWNNEEPEKNRWFGDKAREAEMVCGFTSKLPKVSKNTRKHR